MVESIPVIDLFAGPGGLGEGFSRCLVDGSPAFRICVSVEKDPSAHATLTLRSFFRQFSPGKAPDEYYQYLRGEISRDELFTAWPEQSKVATEHTLGRPHEMGVPEDDAAIDRAIRKGLRGTDFQNWILLGGPPCQAYSLAGRSRRAREDRDEFENDSRHFLYEEYLRIIRKFKPTVFVMENVKGLLSATVKNRRILGSILQDLSTAGYDLHSLSHLRPLQDVEADPVSFLVRAEECGVPQTRHRVFIVGVRKGCSGRPALLKKRPELVDMWDAIGDLPRIRSHVSRRIPRSGPLERRRYVDSLVVWQNVIRHTEANWFGPAPDPSIHKWLRALGRAVTDSGEFIEGAIAGPDDAELCDWCVDERLDGVLNHAARSHMPDDLLRYFYMAACGKIGDYSPRLQHFPAALMPAHANAMHDNVPHVDRFKVQLSGRPSSTITCHISKDGHHYIHPDPTQCRSLTVREAARLQTFPDNYFFEGPRTEQYRQVGNAVPPLLAHKIARVVSDMLNEGKEK